MTVILLGAWALGLLMLPLWVFLAGSRTSATRTARELPHRHPRPPEDHVPSARASASLRDPDRAFAEGAAAAKAFAPADEEEARRTLATHFDIHAVVEPVAERPNALHVIVPVSRTALGMPALGHPSCHFDRGAIASLFENMIGSEVDVEEVECRAARATRCVFRVLPREPPHAPAPATASPALAPAPARFAADDLRLPAGRNGDAGPAAAGSPHLRPAASGREDRPASSGGP